MTWRIYYGDGSTYDGDPYDAPGLNVQVCMMSNADHGRYSQTRFDYYVWSDGEWIGCDIFGLWDYLQQPGPRKVLFGRTLPNGLYQDIRRVADLDPLFDPRTAWMPNER